MRSITVVFEDGNTTDTCINGTNESILKYYIGTEFQFGDTEEIPHDKMVKAVRVIFHDSGRMATDEELQAIKVATCIAESGGIKYIDEPEYDPTPYDVTVWDHYTPDSVGWSGKVAIVHWGSLGAICLYRFNEKGDSCELYEQDRKSLGVEQPPSLKETLMELGNRLVTERGFDPKGDCLQSCQHITDFTDWLNECSDARQLLENVGVSWPMPHYSKRTPTKAT